MRGSVASADRPCRHPKPVQPECRLMSAPLAPAVPARRQNYSAARAVPARRHQAGRATGWHARTSSAAPAVQPRGPKPMPWPSSPTPDRPPPAPNTAPAVADPHPLRPLVIAMDTGLAGSGWAGKRGFAERLRRTVTGHSFCRPTGARTAASPTPAAPPAQQPRSCLPSAHHWRRRKDGVRGPLALSRPIGPERATSRTESPEHCCMSTCRY